jgi:hypothetical protein
VTHPGSEGGILGFTLEGSATTLVRAHALRLRGADEVLQMLEELLLSRVSEGRGWRSRAMGSITEHACASQADAAGDGPSRRLSRWVPAKAATPRLLGALAGTALTPARP